MNLSTAEQNTMTQLLQDESIIIRPSDKGSQIIIFDSDNYEQLIK